MTDETENNDTTENAAEDTASESRAPWTEHFLAFPSGPRRSYVETGEGSLLKTTVDLVSERNRSVLELGDVGYGIENVPMEFAPNGGINVLNPAAFDAWRSKPLYRSGSTRLTSLDALIAYTNRYKGGDTVGFASDDRKAPSLTTVFDYHAAGAPDAGGQAFGRHTALFNLPLSDEWQAWNELNGESITMPNFARFLEDHIVDVMPLGLLEFSDKQQQFVDTLGGKSRIADPAKLMELATGLRVYEDSVVSQATNLQSGEGELTMVNNHTDGQGGKLLVPSMFVIAIPVFRHGPAYQIIVRLRYRKVGGITFTYELWREDQVFDHAFGEASNRLASEASIPLFLGSRS